MPKRKDPLLAGVRCECFLLCDAVDIHRGKVYILGGGWDRLTPDALPHSHTLTMVARIIAPAIEHARSLPLRIDVVQEDGSSMLPEPLLLDLPPADEGEERIWVDEVGYLVQIGMRLEFQREGKYTVQLSVSDRLLSVARFAVQVREQSE